MASGCWVLTERAVKEKLEEYQTKYAYQTFKGALLYIGLFAEDLAELRMKVEAGSATAKRIWRMLEKYKLGLEVKMEEWLLYQNEHEDLKNVKYYNWENLKFLLKCSNRTYYDNGVSDAWKVLPRRADVIEEKQKVLPSNRSELKLWKE